MTCMRTQEENLLIIHPMVCCTYVMFTLCASWGSITEVERCHPSTHSTTHLAWTGLVLLSLSLEGRAHAPSCTCTCIHTYIHTYIHARSLSDTYMHIPAGQSNYLPVAKSCVAMDTVRQAPWCLRAALCTVSPDYGSRPQKLS